MYRPPSEPWRPCILVPVRIAAGIERWIARQQPLAGNEIHLEANPVGILEDEEIVARRPVALQRPAVDAAADAADLLRHLVDILARAGAQAEMMQPDPVLVEAQ